MPRFVSRVTPKSSDTYLKPGQIGLFLLGEGDGDAIKALVRIETEMDPETGVASGTIIDYLPEVKEPTPPITTAVDRTALVQKAHVLGVQPSGAETLIVQAVDRQGAPWYFQDFHKPMGPLKESVVGKSPSYFDASGNPVEVFDTGFQGALTKMAVVTTTLFRQRPALGDSDRVVSEGQKVTYKDARSVVWNVYQLSDATRGAVGFYATEDVFGSTALVGPSRTLVDLSRDIRTFVDVSNSSSLFERNGSGDYRTVVVTSEESTAPSSSSSSNLGWFLGAAGLLYIMTRGK